MPRLLGEPLDRDRQICANAFRPWHIGRRTCFVRDGTAIEGEIVKCVVVFGTDIVRNERGEPTDVSSRVTVYLRGDQSFDIDGQDTIVFTDRR